MSFDWPRFLREHRIEYVLERKDNIAVRCPFCGDADPSHHLGISLKGRGWHCWRNSAHSGKSRARLIQQLLRVSPEEARRLAYGDAVVPSDDELGDMLSALASEGAPPPRRRALELPREFKPLMSHGLFAGQFRDYLMGRGYRIQQVQYLASAYELHYATKGEFAWRIIFPVRDRRGQLLTWTARTISPREKLRYKALKLDRDGTGDGGSAQVKDLLLGLPMLRHAESPRALVVCEGPFDALRITAFGHRLGVYGTCLFGVGISPAQADLLLDLRAQFSQQYLLLDPDAELSGLRLAEQVPGLRLARLPAGVADPGELSPVTALNFCYQLAGKDFA
jgi:hypothetical protein